MIMSRLSVRQHNEQGYTAPNQSYPVETEGGEESGMAWRRPRHIDRVPVRLDVPIGRFNIGIGVYINE